MKTKFDLIEDKRNIVPLASLLQGGTGRIVNATDGSSSPDIGCIVYNDRGSIIEIYPSIKVWGNMLDGYDCEILVNLNIHITAKLGGQ